MANSSTVRFVALTTVGLGLMGCLLFVPRVRAFVPLTQRKIFFSSRSNLSSPKQCQLANTSSISSAKGMPTLPPDVVKYTQVPKGKVFTATTVPSGLLKQHNTKKGTWGVIRVSQGQLEYKIHEPNESVHVLDTNHLGIIEPRMLHQVKPLTDDVEFVVEFWRVPGTGAVNEKREGLNE